MTDLVDRATSRTCGTNVSEDANGGTTGVPPMFFVAPFTFTFTVAGRALAGADTDARVADTDAGSADGADAGEYAGHALVGVPSDGVTRAGTCLDVRVWAATVSDAVRGGGAVAAAAADAARVVLPCAGAAGPRAALVGTVE